MSTASLPHIPEEPSSPAESDDGEDLGPPQIATFLQHISAVTRHSERVAEEHVYSRRWDDDDDAARETRLLLVNPTTSTVQPADACPIDVETVDEPINLTDQDEKSSLATMMEFQEHSALASREVPDDAIDNIDQSLLSTAQRRLLRRVLSALDGYRLARKAVVGQRGAAFVARVQCDRCSARVRRALAAAGWTRSLCAWLHGLLLTKLGKESLPLYLEVVQTLSSKVPGLVDRLTAGGGTRHGALSTEALTPLLRRPWDPAATIIAQHRLTRLPNSPLLVVVPASPCHSSSGSGAGPRRLFWQRQLASLGRVVNIDVFDGRAPSRGISVGESLAHILAMCRQQLSELRRPGRPLVLLGWGAASLVAAHLALVEPVSALVALGFPCWSAAGQRGVGDDPLLECRAPTLLVVGETATDAAPQELERLRRRGRAETSLVVVGGADRRLLVNPQKRARQALTQNMVDRAIMEEIGQFLTRILAQQLDGARPVFARPPSPPTQRSTDDLTRNSGREKRRRVNGHAAAGRPRVPRQQLRPGDTQRPPRTSKKVPGKASPVPMPAVSSGPEPVAAPSLPTVEATAATPEPPGEPRSSRGASPAADDSPAASPAPVFTALPGRTVQTPAAAASPLKIATTPSYRLQSPVGAIHESGLIAITPQTVPTRHLYGPARPHPAEARGRLKVSQKRPLTGAGTGPAKPGRGRGSRSRAPRYGVAGPELRPGLARLGQVREFSAAQMGSSRFLTPTTGVGRPFPAPAAAAAAPGPERASQQHLVYVRPPATGTARPRSVLVGRGRGHRTVTYVPAGQQSRPTLPDDP